MTAQEANTAAIKKKIGESMPGTPFYPELIEEIIKEDYTEEGPALRESILNSLKITEEKTKTVVKAVSYRVYLTDGLKIICGSGSSLGEIVAKIEANETTLANQRKSVWEKIKTAFRQMMNNESVDRVIDLEYMDPLKAVPVKLKLNYHQFRSDLEKKIRMFTGITFQGGSVQRFDSMSEEQLISLLEKNIREVQIIHRTLTALDEYYKAEAPKDLRDKIKGIRPELAAVKNSFVKANQLRHEYTAHKEEEEQMKRLGIAPGV